MLPAAALGARLKIFRPRGGAPGSVEKVFPRRWRETTLWRQPRQKPDEVFAEWVRLGASHESCEDSPLNSPNRRAWKFEPHFSNPSRPKTTAVWRNFWLFDHIDPQACQATDTTIPQSVIVGLGKLSGLEGGTSRVKYMARC